MNHFHQKNQEIIFGSFSKVSSSCAIKSLGQHKLTMIFKIQRFSLFNNVPFCLQGMFFT